MLPRRQKHNNMCANAKVLWSHFNTLYKEYRSSEIILSVPLRILNRLHQEHNTKNMCATNQIEDLWLHFNTPYKVYCSTEIILLVLLSKLN